MGNQGTASKVLRRSAAMVQAGVLGTGPRDSRLDEPAHLAAGRTACRNRSRCPKNLHWNAWLGPAPKRDYADGYAPVRLARLVGFWNRRAGRHGLPHDEHAFHGADLRDPVSVMAETSGHNKRKLSELVDHSLRIRRHQQAAGRQNDLVRRRQAASVGIVGGGSDQRKRFVVDRRKGEALFAGSDGNTCELLGGARKPDVTFRESPGHFEEFVAAIKGGDPAVSNFPDYAGPLTEIVLLGNLAVWAADSGSGPKIEWDAKLLAAKNVLHLEPLIRPEYRAGYSI